MTRNLKPIPASFPYHSCLVNVNKYKYTNVDEKSGAEPLSGASIGIGFRAQEEMGGKRKGDAGKKIWKGGETVLKNKEIIQRNSTKCK